MKRFTVMTLETVLIVLFWAVPWVISAVSPGAVAATGLWWLPTAMAMLAWMLVSFRAIHGQLKQWR